MMYIIIAIVLINSIQASVRDCDAEMAGQGKRECLLVPGYEGKQWTRCSNDSYMDLTSNSKYRCKTGSGIVKNYCWYPCQLEKFHEESGTIHNDCACGVNKNDRKEYRKNNVAIENEIRKLPTKTLKNCSYANDGENVCHHETTRYIRSQWTRCSSNAYIQQKSGGKFNCADGMLYCWFTCQQDEFKLGEGDVYNECYCNLKRSDTSDSSVVLPTRSSYGLFLVAMLVVSLTF